MGHSPPILSLTSPTKPFSLSPSIPIPLLPVYTLRHDIAFVTNQDLANLRKQQLVKMFQCLSLPFLSFPPRRDPPIQLGGLGERRELPQQGTGRSPGHKRTEPVCRLCQLIINKINLHVRPGARKTS